MPSDEGYREIQLNGKQMIFLFMATTIVAVVIFLCGVTVGRGVRNATAVAGAEPAVGTAPAVDIAPVAPDPQATNKLAAGPPSGMVPPAPPPEPESGSGGEQGTMPQPKTAAAAAASEKPAGANLQTSAAPARPAASVSAAASSASEPVGEGYAVQVVALRDRNQAEARAKDLMAKGYSAYVVVPSEAGGVFRVRIGKFKERRQADAVMRRLKKEEKSDSFLVPTR